MEYAFAFQVTKMVVFFIDYHTLWNNKNPYFTTYSARFIKNKRDYSECGQCQQDILPVGSLARKFYDKWNSKHLRKLTDEELSEMLFDVECLKNRYNYIEKISDKDPRISFHDVVVLSKLKPKYSSTNRKERKN